MDDTSEEQLFRKRTRKGRNLEASPDNTLQGEESIEDVCSQRAVEASLEQRKSNEEASGIARTEAKNVKPLKLKHKPGYIIKTRTTCMEDEKGYTQVKTEEYYEKEPHVEQKLTEMSGVQQTTTKKRLPEVAASV